MSDITSDIVMYGTTWCPDCRRSKRLLEGNQIEYKWIDIDQEEWAAAEVIKLNQGGRVVPTIVFSDGTFLAEPSDQVLATKLGLE